MRQQQDLPWAAGWPPLTAVAEQLLSTEASSLKQLAVGGRPLCLC